VRSVDPSVTVVVPVRDGARYLASCLAAIEADPYPAALREILVADNGSTDGSTDIARSLGARVISKPGIRVSALRNAAAREAKGDLLAFIDVDHRISAGWLPAALAALSDSQVVAAGAPYRSPADPTWVQVMYDAMRDHAGTAAPTRWLGSGNLVVRRAAFGAVGGFDADLEACEDVDLCRRLRLQGGTLVSTPGMISVHLGDPATLGSLFRGELWRGRDNLRVSLRAPVSWRDMPSIVVPMLWLVVLALGAGTLLAPSRSVVSLAAAGAALVFAASALRAAGMIRRAALRAPSRWVQALVVALVYDAARGLSLFGLATHRTRHEAGTA
jgi:GT2 family glycosyltransferase